MKAYHREERPWGWFEILYEEQHLKIKKILVKPRKRLSYQSHEGRTENWTIIQGQAVVILEDRRNPLTCNQMIFIPARAKHRIENSGTEDLIFIEIQTGSYLGEDDIIRFEDDYKRI